MRGIDTDRRDVGPYKVILRTEYKPFLQINTDIIRSEATLNFAFYTLHFTFKKGSVSPFDFYFCSEAALTITEKSAALSEAPPMRPPSTLTLATSSAALPAFIEPPY